MRKLLLVFAVFASLALPSIAHAQAALAGVVKDSSGAVLPGVTVEAASPALIEKVRTVVTDGMEIGRDGEVLFTAIERNAIMARNRDGKIRTVAESPLLAWPDSLAFGPDGALYVTTSQIHRTPMFDPTATTPTEPFRVLRIPY